MSMSSWIINATIEHPHGDPKELAQQLTDELPAGVCSFDEHTVTVSFALDDHSSIVTKALIARALDHLPGGRLVEFRVRTEQSLVDELEQPVIPSLVGISEAAEILGVSRQRAHAIAAGDAFPSPIAHLAAGPVFLETAVRAFAAKPRHAGRPRVDFVMTGSDGTVIALEVKVEGDPVDDRPPYPELKPEPSTTRRSAKQISAASRAAKSASKSGTWVGRDGRVARGKKSSRSQKS